MQNLNPLLMNNYLDPFGIGCMKPKINYVRTYKGVIYTKKNRLPYQLYLWTLIVLYKSLIEFAVKTSIP